MIFKETYNQVLNGTKTQTRRPVKPGEELWWIRCDERILMMKFGELGTYRPPTCYLAVIQRFANDKWRIKWRVDQTLAIQLGRGKKAVGRIRITKIRRERLRNISEEDCRAEGLSSPEEFAKAWDKHITHAYIKGALRFLREGNIKAAFMWMWNFIYKKPYSWPWNPEVWVLEFERVIGKEEGG